MEVESLVGIGLISILLDDCSLYSRRGRLSEITVVEGDGYLLFEL